MFLRTVTLITLFFSLIGTHARELWLTDTLDLGLIREADGPRSGRFSMVNLGPDSLLILSVRPDCGCTSTNYTSSPILPGDTAHVQFTFNPANRFGKFTKVIQVRTRSTDNGKSLIVKGTILGSDSTLNLAYPIDRGFIRLKSPSINLGAIPPGESRRVYLDLYNPTTQPITPYLRFSSPDCRAEVFSVSPFSEGFIILTVKPEAPETSSALMYLSPDPDSPGFPIEISFR